MWSKRLFARVRQGGRGGRCGRSRASRHRRLHLERLESREVLSADLQAVLADALADHVIPGQTLQVQVTIANAGPDAPETVAVDYYLSDDAVITIADRLVAATVQSAPQPGTAVTWVQTVTVPASVPHAHYFLGIVVTGDGDTAPGNNAVADTDDTAVLYTSLNGSVTYNGQTRAVAIRPYTGAGAPLLDDVPTWIVIHGRNSAPSASNLTQLAASLDGFSPSDQVLALDWSSAAASGLWGGAGENYIKPVAQWASAALTAYGLEAPELNLVGHSWGAYVAAELAERTPGAGSLPAGKVNSIVALDPATDYPGGSYNPAAKNEVNFARNSRSSWALYASGGIYGSAAIASTAQEAMVVTATDHSKLVNVFADLVTLSYAPSTAGAATIGAQFNPDRLLTGTLNLTWKPNSYTSAGRRSATGPFEAVLTATREGLRVKSLKLFNGRTEVVYYA